jgi:hypothetical protein
MPNYSNGCFELSQPSELVTALTGTHTIRECSKLTQFDLSLLMFALRSDKSVDRSQLLSASRLSEYFINCQGGLALASVTLHYPSDLFFAALANFEKPQIQSVPCLRSVGGEKVMVGDRSL